jgi:hypothetical protein
MTDFSSILNKSEEMTPLGTFIVQNGNVSKGSKLLLSWFNGNTALIPLDARSTFTLAAEHQMFDQIIMHISQGSAKIQYVDSIRGFMNPAERFKDFIHGKLSLSDFGIEDKVDVNLPALYRSATDVFKELFGLPTPPKSEGIDLTSFLDERQQDIVQKWRDSNDNQQLGDAQIKAAMDRDPQNRAVLKKSGNRIVSYNGASVTHSQFKNAYKGIKKIWDNTPPNGEVGRLGSRGSIDARERASSPYAHSQNVDVYNSFVSVGCNKLPRLEVERIAQLLGVN